MPSSPEPEPSLLSKFNSSLKKLFRNRKKSTDSTEPSNLRETLEELIEEHIEDGGQPIPSDERELLGNLVNFTELTAADVMVPRVDIVALTIDTTEEELLSTFTRTRMQRIPVYRHTLDEILGVLHVQDVLAWKASGKKLVIKNMIKEVLFISPTMRALDLMYSLRQNGSRLAIVVDEFGGVDGLVSLTTIVEKIVGNIHDDQVEMEEELHKKPDGSIVADGRFALEEIEESMGLDLMVEDLEDEIETIGGLVSSLAGRVPVRGELIHHPKLPIQFEVVEADPRRIKRVKIRVAG
ncbi:MAG: HlyC/CorC family transporter [Candidatus Paracaedibacteraceae bacterium]|nr:HlyC/CorC family transporter [Candidatus Paracaedibacteraceae bacterium]